MQLGQIMGKKIQKKKKKKKGKTQLTLLKSKKQKEGSGEKEKGPDVPSAHSSTTGVGRPPKPPPEANPWIHPYPQPT